MLRKGFPTFLQKSTVSSKREQKNSIEPVEGNKEPDSCGRTPLHKACWDGEDEKVQELLNTGDTAQVNAKDQWGRTPLWCAVNQGNLETVKILVENKNVKLDIKDSYGKDLTFRAKEKGFNEIVEELQKAKDNRELSKLDMEVQETSEQALKTKLESAENQLFELEKKHAGQLHNLEMSCSEAVEKLIQENEDKISKLKDKQLTETKILKRMVESINEKLSKSWSQPACPAPTCPPLPPQLPCPECPVCMENMLPPRRIFQCQNGHIICEICQPRMKEQKCPTCFQVIVGRAVAMEQHLRDLFMN